MRKKKEKPIRVAMLGQRIVPIEESRRGAIEVVVEKLSLRLTKMGCKVTCYNQKKREYDPKVYCGIRLKATYAIRTKNLEAVTSAFFASFKAAFGRYDIVHFHGSISSFWMWLPWRLGKKCVVTLYDAENVQKDINRGMKSRFARAGEKRAMKYATEIIVPTERLRDYVKSVHGRETVVVPFGAEQPHIHEPDKISELFGLEENGYLLYMGRLAPGKGLETLIEAYKGLDTDKKLVIAGEMPKSRKFAKKIERLTEGEENIFFANFVFGQFWEELFSNAYICVFPGSSLGMSLSLLEAMSYDNCCVVSDTEAHKEIVSDRAILFKNDDVADLKDKLQSLLDNPETIEDFKAEASWFICQKYDWDKFANKMLGIYQNLIATSKNGINSEELEEK